MSVSARRDGLMASRESRFFLAMHGLAVYSQVPMFTLLRCTYTRIGWHVLERTVLLCCVCCENGELFS